MSTVNFIKRMSETNSRLDKEEILKDAWMQGERALFTAIRLTYDILTTFGVKKVVEIIDPDEPDFVPTFTFKQFMALADKLSKRQLTGHAARDAINAAAETCSQEEWNLLYRRILLKDLRCGISETTVNKVLEKINKDSKKLKIDPVDADEAMRYLTPVFDCQLAHPSEKYQNKMKGKKLLDYKLDGVRLLTILDKENNTVFQYTRNGNLNENFDLIRLSLAQMLPSLSESLVLDGEITGNTFQEIMSQINRKEDVDTDKAKLALFDILPLKDFKNGIYDVPQYQRHEALVEMIPMFEDFTKGNVYVIPKMEVDLDTEEGQKKFSDFNTQAVNAGFEGIMVKDPFAPYECKRTASWLKMKPFIEVSLKAIAFERGKPGTKYADILGAILFAGVEDYGIVNVAVNGPNGPQLSQRQGPFKIEVSVGSGISDEQRKQWWDDQEKMLGWIGEVRADCISKDDDDTSDIYSLRFPRFKGWRGGKPGEKV